MSSKKSSTGNKDKSKQTAKRSKSAGFIESADFKPNWLETGPLSPDMIQPDVPESDQALTRDEYQVMQESLQRFYEESGGDDSVSTADPEVSAQGDLATSLEAHPAPTEVILPDLAAEEPIVEEITDLMHAEHAVTEPDVEPEIAPASDLNSPVDEPFAVLEEELYADIEAMDSPSEPDDWIAALTEVVEGRTQPAPVNYAIERPASEPADASADMFIDEEPEPLSEPEMSIEPDPELAAAEIDLAETTPEVTAAAAIDIEAEEASASGVVETGETATEAIATETTETVAQPTAGPVHKPKPKRRRSRLSALLFLGSLLLLGAAAIVYFVNPFSRIALGSASLARPISSSEAAAPATGSGEWCITGDFLPNDDSRPQLIDSGAEGDILAEDLVFSLDYAISQPGTYEWQVIDCNNEALAFPAAPAWVTTTEPDQSVTFNFDSTERSTPLFFPIPYVVSALDDVDQFQVVGDFQDWNPDDASGRLQRINIGLYQQVRRIARAGTYEAYIIAEDERQAVDAYGRTTSPIPFSFQTDRNGDYVVFLVDTDRGRASIMYDMPPFLTSLAYGNGKWILSLALLSLAALLFLWMIVRLVLLNSRKLQMESGCPKCGRQELMRISRHSGDRLLHAFGIPVYRYRCRNCTWEGSRISEEGLSVSPGLAPVYNEF